MNPHKVSETCSVESNKITIAFAYMGSTLWTFGNVYQTDLIGMLKKYGPKNYRYIMLVPKSQQSSVAEKIPDIDYLYYDDPKIDLSLGPTKLIYSVLASLFWRRISFNCLLKKHNIDIFFGPPIEFPLFDIKTLIWFPDFQHIHFPDMFSESECRVRNKIINKIAKKSTRVILISEYVKQDFQKFAPRYSEKARIFPPISNIDESIYTIPGEKILKRYHIPEKYIFLPNQFWKHKNHCLVLEAIRDLKQKGINIILVCAGNSNDYRNPAFFSQINRKISEWDIRDQIIYLGLIPHKDVLLLMRQSVCVINPSLFEGFGFTVDEGRSIGKTVIISDIPPHKEQNPPSAFYFNPTDKGELAELLKRIWLEKLPGPDVNLEQNARNDYNQRIQDNIQIFTKIINEVLTK